jgi:daunosaminyl-N,N-dimethyltransferase/N-dimethyltransferase
VLEVACGSGSFLVPLAERYRVSGIDLSPELLAIAARKLPGVPLRPGDMRSFEVDEPVDAVLCLFSSIGYLRDESELRTAAACFARAVRPGGVLLVEPWLDPADFIDGHAGLDTYRSPELSLARASFSRRRGEMAVVTFRWLAAVADRGLESEEETHELWLCPHELLRSVLGDAGFEVVHDPEGLGGPRGRALLRGRRRS